MKHIFIIISFLLLISTCSQSQQLQNTARITIHPVDESDPDWDIVKSEIDRITKDNPDSPVGNKLESFGRIEGPTIGKLFPDWKFYIFRYSNYKKEGHEDELISLAWGLAHTYAISPDHKAKIQLHHHGNYEAYGELLISNKVSAKTTDDAKLIWLAFCEIHNKQWKHYEIKQISDNEWKLGIYSYDQVISATETEKKIVTRTHSYKLQTNPETNQVIEFKSIVETSDERTEPK